MMIMEPQAVPAEPAGNSENLRVTARTCGQLRETAGSSHTSRSGSCRLRQLSSLLQLSSLGSYPACCNYPLAKIGKKGVRSNFFRSYLSPHGYLSQKGGKGGRLFNTFYNNSNNAESVGRKAFVTNGAVNVC